MKNLILLANAISPSEKCEISHTELSKINPHTFRAQHNLKDIDIKIVSVSCEEKLLKVMVQAWCDSVEIAVDNPLYYKNAPILVPDGTFETVIDENGEPKQIANFVENQIEALQIIVFDTLKVTALKEI